MTITLKALALASVVALSATAAIANVRVSSQIVADDEFKVYISTNDTVPGVMFAQGTPWTDRADNTLILLGSSPNYFIHVWVKDVFAVSAGFLGQFTMPAASGCRFANGSSTSLLTNTRDWKVTEPLGWSPSTPPVAGVPAAYGYFTNIQPPYVQPTITPASHGANGVAPWTFRPGFPAAAEWIWVNPKSTLSREAWFSSKITCRTAAGPTGTPTGLPTEDPKDPR